MHQHAPPPKDLRRPVMLASLAAAVLMLVGKLTAYYITGSAAIFSDAMESVIHGLATAFAAFSLWLSVRPPDESHPYGHGKIAYFSSGFEGGLIMIAAGIIIYEATTDLIFGSELKQLNVGLLITAGLMLVNLALGLALIRIGKRHNSIILVSNGRHVMTDMWTSLGVVIGVGIVWITGITWLDPVTAIAVGVNILWTAGSLMRRAVKGLMEGVEPADTARICAVLDRAVAEGRVSAYHELRHRLVDDYVWVEYHLLFGDDLTVTSAHAAAHAIDNEVRALFHNAAVIVTAHLEPVRRHDDAHPFGHEDPLALRVDL